MMSPAAKRWGFFMLHAVAWAKQKVRATSFRSGMAPMACHRQSLELQRCPVKAPFHDLLVIETASVLAGPSVGMFFAELGARVIKIEHPRGGDVTRSWKLPSEDEASPVSAYFSSVNWGKEHRSLDLKDPSARESFDGLIREADILLTNHMAKDAAKLGLQIERLRDLNPKLIIGHIKGFAEQPDRPAFDVVLQAETGFISMTGTDEAHLAKMPVALIDILAAHQLKEGLLVALLLRERHGRGIRVEVSLEEAALSGLINQASNHLMTGAVAAPMGTLHPNIAPYGELFRCADGGSIILAVGSDAQFHALCNVLHRPGLASDERFSTNASRVRNRTELASELSTAFIASPRDALLALLIAEGIPAGALRRLDEVLAGPTARRNALQSDFEGRSTLRLRGNAFRLTEL